MVDIAGSYDPNAEASSEFEPLPAGEYRAKIIESDVEDISKTNNYGRCLKLTWQIETGPYDGRLIWDRISLWAENMNNNDKVVSIAQQQFAGIRQATGRVAPQDSQELHDIPCMIRVAVKPASGNYGPSNEVKSVKPANAGQSSATNQTPRFAPPANQAAAAQKNGSAPWPRRQTA